MADLTTAYNDFATALSGLLKAFLDAALDPETWSAIAELAVSIPSLVFAGIGIGGCVLSAIP